MPSSIASQPSGSAIMKCSDNRVTVRKNVRILEGGMSVSSCFYVLNIWHVECIKDQCVCQTQEGERHHGSWR